MKHAHLLITLLLALGCMAVFPVHAGSLSITNGVVPVFEPALTSIPDQNPATSIVLDETNPPVSVVLIPDPTSLTVPPHGGTFTFAVHVTNSSNRVVTVEYSTFVRLPSGGLFGPTSLETVTLVPYMDQTFPGLSQAVPQAAPAGLYEFIVQLRYADRIAEDSFLFVKTGVPGPAHGYELDDWKNSATSIKFNLLNPGTERPCSYGLHGPYPNASSLSTNFTVTLPKESDLTVRVYNTTGQVVTDLARGRYPAGEITLTFDAHRLAGGVYFVTAEVPGKFDATQKVVVR